MKGITQRSQPFVSPFTPNIPPCKLITYRIETSSYSETFEDLLSAKQVFNDAMRRHSEGTNKYINEEFVGLYQDFHISDVDVRCKLLQSGERLAAL